MIRQKRERANFFSATGDILSPTFKDRETTLEFANKRDKESAVNFSRSRKKFGKSIKLNVKKSSQKNPYWSNLAFPTSSCTSKVMSHSQFFHVCCWVSHETGYFPPHSPRTPDVWTGFPIQSYQVVESWCSIDVETFVFMLMFLYRHKGSNVASY